jgi:hypothetical protein
LQTAYYHSKVWNKLFFTPATSVAASSLPNKYLLYNMMGNVSEMVVEKGIARGLNYSTPLDSLTIKTEILYTRPQSWLGFRCICEVLEKL